MSRRRHPAPELARNDADAALATMSADGLREVTSAEVSEAYRSTLGAAEKHGSGADEKERMPKLVAAEGPGERSVSRA